MVSKLNKLEDYQDYAFWPEVQNKLQLKYGVDLYNCWFSSCIVTDYQAGNLTISVRSNFIKDWLINNYLDDFNSILSNLLSDFIQLNIEVAEPSDITAEQNFVIDKQLANNISTNNSNDNKSDFCPDLDERFSFSNYVVAEENRIAYAAAQGIISADKHSFINTLFVYAKVGIGKTHLLSAIALELIKQNKKFVFLNAERFTYFYSQAARSGELLEFKEKFVDIDYFLLDDAHFLQKKAGTQNEVLNILDNLALANKKIIFAADRKLDELQDFHPKLKSLLSAGVLTQIAMPGEELRKKIILNKIKLNKYQLDISLVNQMSSYYFSSVREIEGALNKIMIHQNIFAEQVTKDNLAEIINDFIYKNRNSEISPEQMIKLIAKFFKLSVAELKSKKRNKELVFARDVVIYLLKKYTKLSLSNIGSHLARDHATILHAHRKFSKQLTADLTLKFEIAKIEELLHNQS